MIIRNEYLIDSLPYIDVQPSNNEIIAANQLIQEELKKMNKTDLHENIPKNPKRYTSDALNEVVEFIGEGNHLDIIDLSRYTELYDENDNLITNRAIISLAYSLYREENLILLSEFGKNQWLMSNDILSQNLARIESELIETQKMQESINENRKRKQIESESKLSYLETRWRDGVRNLVDANVACLKLEQKIKKQKSH